jgi:DNA-directed RNA polymerase omega subunit
MTVKQRREQKNAASTPAITSRFLFVNIAAMRARQLHRGAKPRLSADYAVLEQGKAERIAMEEVRCGLVEYTPEISLAA